MTKTPELDAVWKKRLLERVSDLQSRKNQTTNWGTRLAIRTTPNFLALVHKAAGTRNINLGAYIRRSVARQLARDLGMPIKDVLKLTPYPAEYGKRLPASNFILTGNGGRIAPPDDGAGFGDWDN